MSRGISKQQQELLALVRQHVGKPARRDTALHRVTVDDLIRATHDIGPPPGTFTAGERTLRAAARQGLISASRVRSIQRALAGLCRQGLLVKGRTTWNRNLNWYTTPEEFARHESPDVQAALDKKYPWRRGEPLVS